MKRVFTLLFLFLAAFAGNSGAQTTPSCNAEFAFNITGIFAQFNPQQTDSLAVHHKWSFGDGVYSELVAPGHYYSPGTYTVTHIVKRLTPNGAVQCSDSASRIVQIGNTTTCNLVANFGWHADSANFKTIHFENNTANIASADSIRWTFGDGTSSDAVNPTHTYTAAGTYTVCLRVKINNNGSGTPCVSEVCKVIVIPSQDQCNLVANFSWQISTSNNLGVYFSNTSANFAQGDSIRWTFGDGSSSNDVNVYHVYNAPGTYNVCIRIQKMNSNSTAPCVREICKTVVVSAPACNLTVNFTWQVDQQDNKKYFFTNTSTGYAAGDSIRWTFGDGTSSTDLNPVHIYANAGSYQVCLWIKKPVTAGTPACGRDICKTIVIADPCTLVANFVSAPDSSQPNKIYFTNTSTPVTIANASVKWTFGDGGAAYTWNADHIYTRPGTYNVCLRIQTSSTCVREICKTITVNVPCDRQISFVSYPDQNNPRRIYFSNTTGTSTGATAKWTFGDGTTATGWNVVHEYANAGRYNVCLRVEFFAGCVKEKCDSITVNGNSNCLENSKWSFTRNTNDCLRFKFEPLQKNTTWQYHWTFGDGTGSHEMMPEHKYAVSGNYNVCLTVFKSNNCASTTCGPVATGYCLNCDSVIVKYNYVRDPANPNTIAFTAVSTQPIVQQVWTITKFPLTNSSIPIVLQLNNPVYTFGDTGYYRVCLRAYTNGNCVKEYCEIIRIGSLGTGGCTLQAYPNPTSQNINVNLVLTAPEMIHAYIYNSVNVLVREKHQQGTTGPNLVTINVETLVPGQYTIKLVYGNNVCYAQFQKL